MPHLRFRVSRYDGSRLNGIANVHTAQRQQPAHVASCIFVVPVGSGSVRCSMAGRARFGCAGNASCMYVCTLCCGLTVLVDKLSALVVSVGCVASQLAHGGDGLVDACVHA